ncbi:MAG TPA: MarC family protein [Paraburkholderia sp.]|uniref:MarC family protein n=1 Tax=Paraburkholderia sp. TaxID=1926495 RepID=UPI002ED5E007
MVESLISDILFGFTGLISIINPIGIAFVFLDRTASLTTEERTALARKIAINVMCVVLVAFFLGAPILHFFGISMEALRIGGGLAVAVGGWQMLNAPDTQPADQPGVKRVDAESAKAKAFFPLTIPLTTGPGSIATAIALTANRTHKLSAFVLSSIASVVISLAVAATVYLIYSRAAVFAKYLGVEGTKVAMRVSSFLLLCIGVQIMLTGFSEFLIPIATMQPAANAAANP